MILFSPIGRADPITQLGDGPMLHIVRHRRPSKVVLFLSPEMLECQNQDERYTESIEKLVASTGQPRPDIEIIESDWQEAHRFDHYIEVFEERLSELSQEAANERILVNVTSGTPAMQQALVAIGAFGRFDLELLQVSTPRKRSGENEDREALKGYDLDLLWECNPDNNGVELACRVECVELPHFRDRLLRENIITLVEDYDYAAALKIANQTDCISAEAKEMIEAARDRLNLRGQKPAQVFGGTDVAYKRDKPLLEYLSVMETLLKQERWADFLRSLTPALTETMQAVLDENLPRHKYLKCSAGKFTSEFDWEKIDSDEELRNALESKSGNRSKYVTNESLGKLIEKYCKEEGKKNKSLALRDLERNARNSLAHEVREVNKRNLERSGRLSLEEAMRYLFELNGGEEGLYDRVNERIMAAL